MLVFIQGLFAQEIIRVIPKFVLIDTDQNMGEIGDMLTVYRETASGPIQIGKVKIVRFSKGNTGAKIVRIEPGLSISIGDFVQNEKVLKSAVHYFAKKKEESETTSRQSIGRIGIQLSRFVPGYALNQILESCYSVGASLIVADFNPHTFFIDWTYPLLELKPAMSDYASPSLWSIHLGDRIHVGKRICYDAGVGLVQSSLPLADSVSQGTSRRSDAGFFLGMSLPLNSGSSMIMLPFIRCYLYQSEGEWRIFALAGMCMYLSFIHF
jgi:hypothetical protein